MECEEKKKRKIEKWQDECKDKEVEGCTFKPELVTHQAEKEQSKRTME